MFNAETMLNLLPRDWKKLNLDKLQGVAQKLENYVVHLEELRVKDTADINKLKTSFAECEKSNTKLKEENLDLKKNLEKVDENINELNQRIERRNKKIEELNLDISNANKHIETIKNEKEKALQELNELKESTIFRDKEDESVKNAASEAEIKNLTEKIKELENEKISLKAKIKIQDEDKELTEQLVSKEVENGSLSAKLKSLELKNRSLEENIEKLNSEILIKEKEAENVKKQYNTVVLRNKNQEEYIAELTNSLTSLTVEKGELQVRFSRNEKLIERLKKDLEDEKRAIKTEIKSSMEFSFDDLEKTPAAAFSTEKKKNDLKSLDKNFTPEAEKVEETTIEPKSSEKDVKRNLIAELEDKNTYQKSHSSLKINASIKEFNGNGRDRVEDWIYHVNRVLQACGIEKDKDKVLNASSFLKENAMYAFQSFEKTKPDMTWNDFCEFLINKYRPVDHEMKVRRQIKSLKQTKSISEYVTEFRMLMNQVEKMEMIDQITYFIDGLHPKTKNYVKLMNPTDIEKAISFAETYEPFRIGEDIGKNDSSNIFFSNSSRHGTKKYHQFQAARSRYKTKKEIHKLLTKDENKKEYRCFLCNKIGHIKANCYKNKAPKTMDRSSSKSFKAKAQKEAKVYTVDEIFKSDTLLRYNGLLNNKEVEVVFDTGATVSLLNADVANKLDIEILPSDRVINTADGSTNPVLGITREVEVKVDETIAKICFLITNVGSAQVLLGLDWFEQTKVVIDPARKQIKIPGKCISLNEDDYQNDENFENIFLANDDVDELDEFGFNSVKFRKDDAKYQNEKVKSLVDEYSDVFSNEIDNIGCFKGVSYEIETTTEVPVTSNAYRLPFTVVDEMKQEVDKMLKAGIIRPGKAGTWTSPAFLIKQKHGSRFVVDYRKLNANTKPFLFPLPRIDDILDKLSNGKIFSSIDLKKGYFQMQVSELSKHKTGFIVPFGIYEFNRVPFGLCNAPSYFSSIMQNIFGNLDFVQIFIDDIIIWSENEEQHLEHLKIVFDKLRENGLTLNGEKCNWMKSEISILGHIVDATGIRMDPEKIEAIKNRKPPKTVKQLQSFLGCSNYYRRFVEFYAKIAAPLHGLCTPDKKWLWNEACEYAFNKLKEKLTSYPILRKPDFSKPFKLSTDASTTAIGAILSQEDENGNEYVVCYASRLLKPSERNYSITELECLAVFWAVNFFRTYLFGRWFLIVTDHYALKWLLTIKNPNARLTRWAVLLQMFKFDIVHRKGKLHSNVDALSRPVLSSIEEEADDQKFENEDISSKNLDPYQDAN